MSLRVGGARGSAPPTLATPMCAEIARKHPAAGTAALHPEELCTALTARHSPLGGQLLARQLPPALRAGLAAPTHWVPPPHLLDDSKEGVELAGVGKKEVVICKHKVSAGQRRWGPGGALVQRVGGLRACCIVGKGAAYRLMLTRTGLRTPHQGDVLARCQHVCSMHAHAPSYTLAPQSPGLTCTAAQWRPMRATRTAPAAAAT